MIIFTMRMLTVSLLFCVMMVLTMATRGKAMIKRSTSCPPDWTGFNNRCFLFVSTVKPWAYAEKHCQSHGGNLASVHSLEEHHMIQGVIQKVTNSYPLTWLGGSDAEQEGAWFWSDGTPFSFTNWSPGQPDGHKNANCLVINYGGGKKLDDQPCKHKRPFVCAKKA